MTQRVYLQYRTVKGKQFLVVLDSKAKALETLHRLKKMGIVQTYAKGRKTRSLILPVHYCPICKKILDIHGRKSVTLLDWMGKAMDAHRSCCEKAKIPYRLYDATNKGNENTIVYPK
jgi:hypothetical protein